MVGRAGLNFLLFSVPLLCVSPWIGAAALPANLRAGILFIPSLGLAIAVGMAIEFLFAGGMVALELDVYTINRLRAAAAWVLSGGLLPLPLLPWGLGRVFTWLPFAATASAPLRIFTAAAEPYHLMALQAGWAVILWPLTCWIWAKNREKIVCQGG